MKTKVFLLLTIATIQLKADSLNQFLPNWKLFKKETHSLQWLYGIAQHNGFEKHEEVIKNRAYYIAAIEGHIKQLEKKLQTKSHGFSYKKMLIGSGASLYGFSLGLNATIECINKIFLIDRGEINIDYRINPGNNIPGKILFIFASNLLVPIKILLGAHLFNKGLPFIKKAFKSKDELIKRLERDKRILEILKTAE